MITTEGPARPRKGIGEQIATNANGGKIRKTGQPINFIPAGDTGVLPQTYNVGFGSTMPTAAWVDWTAAQCDIAGVSTSEMDPTKPKSTQKVQINVPAANIATVGLYGKTKGSGQTGFFELYESQDDRRARHAALRAAGYTPPFPRADRFYKNKHQGTVQVGLQTSPHNLKS